MTPTTPTGCPFRWHMLPCALPRAHGAPHHIVAEQPELASIEAETAEQERERLRAALDAYLHVGDAWKPGILRWVRDDLLADPEPAK